MLKLPLAQNAVDRDYLSRESVSAVSDILLQPNVRVLPMLNGEVPTTGVHSGNPELVYFDAERIASYENLIYLGKSELETDYVSYGAPILLAILNRDLVAELGLDEFEWHGLRKTGAGLNPLDAGVYTQALAINNWHQSHQFCPGCGSATEIIKAGWSRKCLADGQEIFPRTDPAIIVGVIDQQERILLGSQGSWGENRWSILAGFVEAGESLQAAVIREMYEEAGVRVTNPRYLGSQAWPFPASLMVGFFADLDPDHPDIEAVPDGIEIERLRWFSRAEIEAEADRLYLPSRLSISRAIIEHWFGAEIVCATDREGL